VAISFNEVDQYYIVADAAELTLPNGDWCLGIWTYVSDNTGVAWQYLVSTGGWGAVSTINLHLGEVTATASGQRNRWLMNCEDDDGTNPGDIIASTATGADSKWRLIIFQRNTTADAGHEFELWFCEPGASATKEADASDASFGAINGGDWNIGRRADGDAARYYGSVTGEFFKGDFALTQAQVEALGAGLPIKSLAKRASLTLDVYLPMWEAHATLLDYSANGNSGTRSGAPVTVSHPPICTPIKRRRM
jgi:hypothetical protein